LFILRSALPDDNEKEESEEQLMWKRKIPMSVLLVLALCLMLAGCSGGESPATASPESAATPTPEAVTQAPAETPGSEAPVELLVYAGAGLKSAMDAIKTAYEADHNVTIEYVYAGSTQLISQIELSGKGDVFIVGSENAYQAAKEDGFASDTYYQVAHHTPCIAVQAGNPKGITSLEDLAKEGITVILGDPKANAIGQTAQKLIEKTGLAGINDNCVSQAATVNEIVTQIASGQADAGIVTFDNVHSNADIEIIEIPAEQNIDQIIPVCTLTLSEHPDAAQSFVDFIASDAGKQIFKDSGFEPVG
jgi:molybdate transport system substrate-binding protein